MNKDELSRVIVRFIDLVVQFKEVEPSSYPLDESLVNDDIFKIKNHTKHLILNLKRYYSDRFGEDFNVIYDHTIMEW